MGNIVMFAEVSGIADFDSPENKQEWSRVIKEKKMPVSASEKPLSRRTLDNPPPARRRAKSRPSTE